MWWQKLVTFILTVLGGGNGNISISTGVKLPKFSIEDKIGIFGREDKVTLSTTGDDDKISLSVAPA
jgi:hypothetical protein